MKISGLDKEFFQLMFSKLYQEHWKSAGKSGEAFAAEIRSRTGYATDRNTISAWKNGKKLPSRDALKAICDIFGVDETVFQPLAYTGFDYRYSPDRADREDNKIARMAKNNFGIDLDFFQGIRKIVPDFDSRFPLNAPLSFCEYDWTIASDGKMKNTSYKRDEHKEASKTNKEKRLFQITRDNKAILLTESDLKIIRLLQNSVKKYVCRLLDKVSADLIAAEMAVNLEFMEQNPISDYYDGRDIVELTDDELQRLDPLGIYTDEEKEKFRPDKKKSYTLEELEQIISVKNGGNKNGQR